MKKALADVYSQYPFELERAEGVYVYDTAGKRYLDFYGGHAVSLLGHSPKEVIDAIETQGRKFTFYSNLASIPIREQAAAKLLQFGGLKNHQVFFCNSGAESNENALKIAIKTSGRSKLIGYKGAFHGRTLLASAVTDNPNWYAYLKDWMGPTQQLRPNNLSDLDIIDTQTAAVILEPIQSIGGVTAFEAEYLRALRVRCDEVGALLIFDEVQTGMGRTGVAFMSVAFPGAEPDMFTLAKGTAGGFPIGVVVMRENVSEKVLKGDIAATFGGGCLAMAALEATLEVVQEKKLIENAQKVEQSIRQCFVFPEVEEIRGRGCLMGIRTASLAKKIQEQLFEKGIIVGVCADPYLVHLLPPLTIEHEHIEFLAKEVRECVQGECE